MSVFSSTPTTSSRTFPLRSSWKVIVRWPTALITPSTSTSFAFSVQQVEQPLGDRQAQPDPAEAACDRSLDLPERLENERQRFLRNAHASISDLDRDFLAPRHPRSRHPDVAAVGVFNGVEND